jgi:DNA-binding transcriptional LysR family regulator
MTCIRVSAGEPGRARALDRRALNDLPFHKAALDPAARLDLNLLGVLVAIGDSGAVGRAAIRLGMSQPAVSGALARLRQYFDDPLFVRAPGGMSPTPRGAEVVDAAREVLRRVDQTLQPGVHFDPARLHRPFTFALSDVGEMVFLPKLVRALAQASPQTPLRSVSLRPAALDEAMDRGDVDLAVGHFPDLKPPRHLQQLLFTHHFVCLLRADHPLQGSRLTMGEFLSLQHVVVQSEGRTQEILDAHLEARGVTRRISLLTPHFMSIPRLIARCDFVVTVPHAVGIAYGRPEHGLKVMQLPFRSPSIELYQHWHRKVQKDARNVWLRALVARLFNAGTDEW